jgi:Family of unknown function (DUF6445)
MCDRPHEDHGAEGGLMFNPRPAVSRIEVAPGAVVTVLDDVLTQPRAMVDLAVRHRAAFTMARENAFPGLELPLTQSVLDRFAELFSLHARESIGARRVLTASGRMSMVVLPPTKLSALQRVCHRDRLGVTEDQCVGAAVLYLFDDPRLGGTSFFRARHDGPTTEALMRHWSEIGIDEFEGETGWRAAYLTTSNQHFDHLVHVRPRFNRLICYDGSLFHGSHIEYPELLCDDPANGRLTLNLFFVCRRTAAKSSLGSGSGP